MDEVRLEVDGRNSGPTFDVLPSTWAFLCREKDVSKALRYRVLSINHRNIKSDVLHFAPGSLNPRPLRNPRTR